MPPQRVLRDTRSQPEVTFYVGTTATEPDAPPTVDITRGDGSAFVTNGATVDLTGVGRFGYTLDPQAELELFTLRWEATFGGVVQAVTTQVEIVGGYYVSLADLKALPGLSTKTDAELAEGRQWFEDLAEDWCGVAFVPRYSHDVLDGTGGYRLDLNHRRPRVILAATDDGTVQDPADWDLYAPGYVRSESGFAQGFGNWAVTYEHGYDGPDASLRQAALDAIQAHVLGEGSATGGTGSGAFPSGITSLTTDAGVMTFGRPTQPTGIGSVDQVLRHHRVPLVA